MSSNYPSGFAGGVTIRGLPLLQTHPGEVFWVNNSSVLAKGGIGGSDGNKGSYREPFSTVTKALTACTASRGDIIAVMPGYVEDIAEAAGEVWNVAGVAIVGLGAGSLKPKFTFSETDSTLTITAANMSFVNLAFEAAVADNVTALDISSVDDLSFESCTFTEGAGIGTFNFTDVIDLADAIRNFSMEDCEFIGNDTNNDAMIVMVGVVGLRLVNCNFYNNVAQGTKVGLLLATDAVNDIDIRGCNFRHWIDAAVTINFDQADNSGVIRDCMFSSIDTQGYEIGGVNASGAHCYECFFSGDVDGWGLVGGGTALYVTGS